MPAIASSPTHLAIYSIWIFDQIRDGKLHPLSKYGAPSIDEVVGSEYLYCDDPECVDATKDCRAYIERSFVETSGGALILDDFNVGTEDPRC